MNFKETTFNYTGKTGGLLTKNGVRYYVTPCECGTLEVKVELIRVEDNGVTISGVTCTGCGVPIEVQQEAA